MSQTAPNPPSPTAMAPLSSADFGAQLAAKLFGDKGRVELHLDQQSLANALAVAHEAGIQAAVARLQPEMTRLQYAVNHAERRAVMFGDVIALHIIAMQSAVIAARSGNGAGAGAGMTIIETTLRGPGHMPDFAEAAMLGDADAWFAAKIAEHEAFRSAHPGPEKLPPLPAGPGTTAAGGSAEPSTPTRATA